MNVDLYLSSGTLLLQGLRVSRGKEGAALKSPNSVLESKYLHPELDNYYCCKYMKLRNEPEVWMEYVKLHV